MSTSETLPKKVCVDELLDTQLVMIVTRTKKAFVETISLLATGKKLGLK